MFKRTVGLVLTGSLLVGIGAVSAKASDDPEPTIQWHHAIVECNHPAEDSMAHLRLEVYDPAAGVLIYHCMRHGY